MIPKELQEAIEKHILNKVENNKNVAEFESDILSEGALLALEYMGDRWVSVDNPPMDEEDVLITDGLVESIGYYLPESKRWKDKFQHLIGLPKMYAKIPPKQQSDEK